MTRYFDATIDGWQRIVVVEPMADCLDPDEEMGGCSSSDEIMVDDLPKDFASWKQYSANACGDAIERVMSPDGS